MPSMSDQVEEDLEFRWGAKKGQRQHEKNVQFYRSFTYDGVKYSLFDSVYVFKDGETEPYVGTLIKIWENEAIGIRRVKLLWFFYPHEVSNYLGNEKVLENELFLACGEGKGLANINPLESIAGKCNVCISRDERNRQPSEHELMVVDYVFYRTFDVDKLIISDKLGEKISCVCQVTDLLSKREPANSILPNVDAVRDKNEPNSVSDIGKGPVLERSSPGGDKTTKDDFILGSLMGNDEKEKHFTEVCDYGVDMSGTKNISSSSGLKQIEAVAVDKFRKDVMRPKTEAPSTFIRSSDAEDNGDVKMPVKMTETNGVKIPEEPAIGIDRDEKTDLKKGFKRLNEAAEGSGSLEVKRAKLLKSNVREKSKGKMVVEDSRIDALPENLKSKEQTNKASGQKLQIAEANHLVRKSYITYGQLVEVTRRPEVDKRKWFTPPPWEDEVKNATERGSLVLLMNLDPASASSEVEDIIWHGCQESCAAKMIAHTAISSPHWASIGNFQNKRCCREGQRKVRARMIDATQWKNGAVSASHGAQTNTLEYDMAKEWLLHQERTTFCWKKLYKLQGEELRKLKAKLKPMQAQAQLPQLGQ